MFIGTRRADVENPDAASAENIEPKACTGHLTCVCLVQMSSGVEEAQGLGLPRWGRQGRQVRRSRRPLQPVNGFEGPESLTEVEESGKVRQSYLCGAAPQQLWRQPEPASCSNFPTLAGGWPPALAQADRSQRAGQPESIKLERSQPRGGACTCCLA